ALAGAAQFFDHMSIPTNSEILALLDRLANEAADDLESQWLDFKPWTDAKSDMKVAVEYAVCFANADGGVVVFGVADRTRGRAAAIHGAKGYNLDVWRRGIFDGTRPNLNVTVEELGMPEGTGRLLVVRVPKGPTPPYGTAQGLFKRRVGKNCMPLDPQGFARSQISSGAIDWSGQPTDLETAVLDPVEIARARGILRRINPESELLKLADEPFLAALGAVRGGRATHAGLILFGSDTLLAERCPQHQVHYVHQVSNVSVARNDSYRHGLLNILERIEQNFTGPANPEQEITVGLFKLRVPAFPIGVVREAVLNAVTHRDYSDPGEVLIRHGARELVVTSPGGFVGGITPDNILRTEPVSRNRTLAEALEKLRLVERAGIGRRRIFLPMLELGKRPPAYEADGTRVTLRVFDGVFDERMAALVAKWRQDGIELDLEGLLILFYLRDHAFVDADQAAQILQLDRDHARGVLDSLTLPPAAMLERRGRTKAVTYHLAKGLASDLHGKAAYSAGRGISPLRYAEMIKLFLQDHQTITPKQCRELLHLGESQSARAEISRHLRKWSGPDGFLDRKGEPPKVTYRLRSDG
ncbi:MAG TPA: RNA-binding domain-containing protein, partial [Opitutus sp.]|nr:RNA-binding domain-containing protein [Opitutus sp.]